MARSDAIVLGAGIVGVSTALHLVKRGLTVTLIDRSEPGRGTSYGNAGIIEGNTLFPAAFPASLKSLIRIALKWAPEANYHASFSRPRHAVAAGVSSQFGARAPRRHHAGDAATVLPRTRRARGADGRGAGAPVLAPYRLAQGLSQRPQLRRKLRANAHSRRNSACR